jgi:hypothetical protein
MTEKHLWAWGQEKYPVMPICIPATRVLSCLPNGMLMKLSGKAIKLKPQSQIGKGLPLAVC